MSGVVALALGALLAATWSGGSAAVADETCNPDGLQRQELSDWVQMPSADHAANTR